MDKRTSAAIVVLAALAALSCAPALSHRSVGSGAVSVSLGKSARTLTANAPTLMPSFGTYTVTVSGSGMSPVSASGTYGSSVTLEVPAGSNRTVSVSAVPDWTDADSTSPVLATLYGGSVTVDVETGKTAVAAVTLGATSTKVIVPDNDGSSFYVADTFGGAEASTASSISPSSNTDIEFDRYGRALVSGGNNVYRTNDFDTTTAVVSDTSTIERIAYDRKNDKFYTIYDDSTLGRLAINVRDASVDPYGTSVRLEDPTNLASYLGAGESFANFDYGLAVDASGIVYAAVKINDGNDGYRYRIWKLDATNPAAPAIAGAAQLWSSADKSYYFEDLAYADGKVFAIADDVDYSASPQTSRGVLYAVNASTMTLLSSIGESDSTPSEPTVQFYGPSRFLAVLPKKLVIADEGLIYDGGGGTNIDRLIQVDTDSPSAWSVVSTSKSLFYSYYDYSFGGY